jgi:D-alanyl-lipoteichoic acid acyltransferase DltB (MBOAT superfamily)
MSVCSVEFVLALLLFAALWFRLPAGGARRAAFAAASALFLAASLPDLASAAALALFVLSGFAVGRRLLRRPSRALFVAYVAALVAAFAVLKRYEVLAFFLPGALFHHPLAVVGLSYVLFRQIQFLVDVLQLQIPEFTLSSYLAWQLGFLTLLSGPIQRYQDFHGWWGDPKPVLSDAHGIQRALQRILVGTLKVAVVAAACSAWFEAADRDLLRAMAGEFPLTRGFALKSFATLLYAYPAYVYFNFSGYCDVVIGGGRLLGLALPENFDRPYLARNMIEFWTRQHITLGLWIRDYLFIPLYQFFASRWPKSAGRAVYLCYFVAFFLAGIWHGATLNFVVFGLLHGLGVSAAKMWETRLVKRRGRAGYKKYLQDPRTRVVSIALTLHFVAFAFLFFTPDLGKTLSELRAIVRAVL